MQLLRDTIAKRVRGRGVALLEKPQTRHKKEPALGPYPFRRSV